MSKIKVYLGIMSTGQREDIHTYLFRDLQERYGDQVEMVFPEQCVWRFPHDHARNAYVEDFLASDCDVLWFLDSDVCPPKFIFDLLVNKKCYDSWKVAGSPYPLWMPPTGDSRNAVIFTTYDGTVRDENGKATGIKMTECPDEGQAFVDAIATGCMFIKREVFKDLVKPYFEFKFHPITRNVIEGEDLGFCLKINDKGIKCLIDYSMVCKHYKRIDLLDVNEYAKAFARNKLDAYDQFMRSQVNAATKKIKEEAFKQGFEAALSDLRERAKPKSSLILPSSYGR